MTEEEKTEETTEHTDEATTEAEVGETPPEVEQALPDEAQDEAPPAEAAPEEEAAADEAPAEPEAEAEPAPEAASAPEAEAEPALVPAPKKKRKRLPRSERRQRPKRTRVPSTERRPIVRLPKPEHERGRRQERRGVVVSNAMDKTIVVQVETLKVHTRYKKVIKRATKFHAHDERNEANVGDVVRIVETRPFSKTKNWRLAEIVEAAK